MSYRIFDRTHGTSHIKQDVFADIHDDDLNETESRVRMVIYQNTMKNWMNKTVGG